MFDARCSRGFRAARVYARLATLNQYGTQAMATFSSWTGAHTLAAATLAAGLALAAPALSRLVGDMAGLSVQAEVQATADGQRLPVGELALAAARLDTARAWSPDPRLARDAAILNWRSDPARAEAALNAALAGAPLQPDLWMWLARLRLERGETAAAWQAVRLSMLSGAVAPTVMLDRLEMALRLRPLMTADDRALLRRQVRLTYILHPMAVRQRMAADAEAAELLRGVVDEFGDTEINHLISIHAHLPR